MKKHIPFLALMSSLLFSCSQETKLITEHIGVFETVNITDNVYIEDNHDKIYSGDEYKKPIDSSSEDKYDFDGIISSDEYKDVKVLTSSINLSSGFELKVTLYLYKADGGFFLAAEVKDDSIFVNRYRDYKYNSGLIFDICANLESNTSYKVALYPDGTYQFFQKGGYDYLEYSVSNKDKPTVKGNISDQSYSIESFIPYGAVKTAENKSLIYANVSLIRPKDATSLFANTYNFGKENKEGFNINDIKTFWQFDDKGTLSATITLTCLDDHGTLTCDKEYAPFGDTVKIEIKPKSGYCVKQLLLNDSDVSYDYQVIGDVCTYVITSVSKDVNFSASFMAEVTTSSTLSGTITCNNRSLGALERSKISVYFNACGKTYKGTISDDNTYRITVPKADGKVKLFDNKNREIASKIVKLSTYSSLTSNLNITDEEFINSTVKYIDDKTVSSRTAIQIFDQGSDFVNATNNQTFVSTVRWNGKTINDDGTVNHKPTNGGDPTNECFYAQYTITLFTKNSNGSAGTQAASFNLQLLHWSTSWQFKVTYDGNTKSTQMTYNDLQSIQGNGLTLAFNFHGNGYTIYRLVNGLFYEIQTYQNTSASVERYLKTISINSRLDNYPSWEFTNMYLMTGDNNSELNENISRYYDTTFSGTKTTTGLPIEYETRLVESTQFIYRSYYKVSNMYSGNNIIYTNGFKTGIRFNLYDNNTNATGNQSWAGVYYYIIGDGSKYYFNAVNVSPQISKKTALNSKQLAKFLGPGLFMMIIRDNLKLYFYSDDGNGNLVKLFTIDSNLSIQKYIMYIDHDFEGNINNSTFTTSEAETYITPFDGSKMSEIEREFSW